MKNQKAARRYAKTLFASSSQKGVLESVVNDMKTLSSVFLQTQELGAFLENPLVTEEQVNRVMSSSFDNHFQPLTVSFIRFLKKKSRLNLLGLIPELFVELFEKDRGIIRVTILSAKPLSESQLERLKAKLKQVYSASSSSVTFSRVRDARTAGTTLLDCPYQGGL